MVLLDVVDINCDMGEAFGRWHIGDTDDATLMALISSANIAAGFHAGDPNLMDETVRLAAEHGVGIGAHPGYRDLQGFGRRKIAGTARELVNDIVYQVGAIREFARRHGTSLQHVKPHGALYNTIAHDARQAEDVLTAILAVDPSLILMALAGSPLIGWAQARGVRVVAEAFADRAYNDDGSLVSRRLPGAVLHDAQAVADRMLQLVQTGRLTSITGQPVAIQADSICVHGDSPGAVDMARQIRAHLLQAGVALQPFVALD